MLPLAEYGHADTGPAVGTRRPGAICTNVTGTHYAQLDTVRALSVAADVAVDETVIVEDLLKLLKRLGSTPSC